MAAILPLSHETTLLFLGLIFMGINFRPVAGYAFLGHRAERVLRGAPCAAAVLGSG